MKFGLRLSVFAACALQTANAAAQVNYAWTNFVGLSGASGYVDATGTAARFYQPLGLALDANGNLFAVDDSDNNCIRKITPAGLVTTIAGSPYNFGHADGTNGSAQFVHPTGIAADRTGNLYVADTGNSIIRKLTPIGTNWIVTTLAGDPNNSGSADGTNATAQFDYPHNLCVDAAGNIFISDTGNNMIRKLSQAGTNWVVTTIAGAPSHYGWADGPGLEAWFKSPEGIAADAAGNLYVADCSNDLIRKLTQTPTNWFVTTIAGRFQWALDDDGTGMDAHFSDPYGLAVDSRGNLYVAVRSGLIRKVTPAGVVTTLTSWAAPFFHPYGIAVDAALNLYVADTDHYRIAKGILPSTNPTLSLICTGDPPRLTICGTVGYTYALEYTPSLAGTNTWHSLMNQTNLLLTNSPQTLADTNSSVSSQRFYRARQVSP
jgi:hypothetical protein